MIALEQRLQQQLDFEVFESVGHGSARHPHADQREQLIDIQGLGHVVVGPCCETAFLVVRHGFGGQHQDRQAAPASIAPDALCRGEPVHDRHHHIHQNEVYGGCRGGGRIERVERFLPVARDLHDGAARFEHAGEGIDVSDIILDDEDAPAFQHGVSISRLLDHALLFGRHGHAFTFDLPTEAVWVTADFTRLSQIVSNLLTNAAKYTPSGGTIQLRANAGPDYVEVAVSDTGVGISKDMQARVFELYTQLKGPDDRSSEGLGIGLALVRQLVDLHKGDIRVESDGPGAGSCFTIRLPRSA